MFDYLYALIIFFIVLLLYLHIIFHLKKNHTNEISYLETLSKKQFENMCDIRQPFIYNYGVNPEEEKLNVQNISNYFNKYEINVLDKTINISNFFDPSNNYQNNISQNNETFLKDSEIYDTLYKNDSYLRPNYTNWFNYDIILGKNNSHTKLTKTLCFRNFLHCVDGEINVKLISFKYDYIFDENQCGYHYNVDIPVFDDNKMNNHKEWKKIKIIDFTLKPGDCLFIPAYWYCACKFNNNGVLIQYNYVTFMNNLIYMPEYLKRKFLNFDINNINFNDSQVIVDKNNTKTIPPTETIPPNPETDTISNLQTNNVETINHENN